MALEPINPDLYGGFWIPRKSSYTWGVVSQSSGADLHLHDAVRAGLPLLSVSGDSSASDVRISWSMAAM